MWMGGGGVGFAGMRAAAVKRTCQCKGRVWGGMLSFRLCLSFFPSSSFPLSLLPYVAVCTCFCAACLPPRKARPLWREESSRQKKKGSQNSTEEREKEYGKIK
jgi:hypothetical protein